MVTITDEEKSGARSFSEKQKPAKPPETWTPFVGGPRLAVPGPPYRPTCRAACIRDTQPIRLAEAPFHNEAYLAHRQLLAFVLYHDRAAELEHAGFEARGPSWTGLLFFLGVKFPHPSGNVVVPYLTFSVGRRPSWNMLAETEQIRPADTYVVV